MPDYRRNIVPGGSFFFTVYLLERRSDLPVRRVRGKHPFIIDAWGVLPDHMHCVWTLPPGEADYALRWQLIKLLFSRALPRTERRSDVCIARHERGIWQRRYWEHTLRDAADFEAHVDYVHINPLKHGLVARVTDWPHSSFHRHVREGLLPVDWAGDKEVAVGLAEERPG